LGNEELKIEKLEIFDILGKKVISLFVGKKIAGILEQPLVVFLLSV
jgi:hypothetical protein